MALFRPLRNPPPPDFLDEQFCTSCEEFKPSEQFFRRPGSLSGYTSWCRSCVAEGSKASDPVGMRKTYHWRYRNWGSERRDIPIRRKRVSMLYVTRIARFGRYADTVHRFPRMKNGVDALPRAIELAAELKARYPKRHYVITEIGRPAQRSHDRLGRAMRSETTEFLGNLDLPKFPLDSQI